MKTKQNIIKVAIYSRPSIHNINNRRFWIWKNRCIIKFNKQSARYLYAKDPYKAKYQYLINKREYRLETF